MIRIRQTDGHVLELPKNVRFIEITDLQGKVGHVLAVRAGGEIQIISATDKVQADKYASLYGVEFCPVVKLPAREMQPGS